MLAGATQLDLLSPPRDLLSLLGSMPAQPGGGRRRRSGWRKAPTPSLAPVRYHRRGPPEMEREEVPLEPGGAPG